MADLRNCYAENQHLQELVGHHQHAKDRISQELDFRMFSLRVSAQIYGEMTVSRAV